MPDTLQPTKIVLAEYKRGDEKIVIEVDRHPRHYAYAVRVVGGRHDGVAIRCNTVHSAVWLVIEISHALVNNPEWAWLQ